MSRADILKYFPAHLVTPRSAQVDILRAIQDSWDRYDVFIINAPVALGKSAIAYTIAEWSGKAAIVTPNNLLRNQYSEEYPDLHMVRARKEYWCSTGEMNVDARVKKSKGKYCHPQLECKGCTDYQAGVNDLNYTNSILANYYGYLAYSKRGAYRNTLIVDEAHNLCSMLREMAARKLWKHEVNYPDGMETRLDMMAWAQSLSPQKLEDNDLLSFFKQQILSNQPSYLFQMSREYHGHKGVELPLLKMLPVDTKGLKHGEWYLWPSPMVKKLVLMSATISEFDIQAFSLGDLRVKYIEAASPIPAEQRPVVIPAEHRSLARKHQVENLPLFAEFVQHIAAENPDTKGLVHVPYSVAALLHEYLRADSRYIFHDRHSKMAQYRAFRESDEPRILVASGMYEGIDLPGDLCRWQIIAKIPYPSLADPALRYMARKSGRWYAWQSIKDTLQASGRVCRNPTDYGVTYIYDSCFERLFEDNEDMFPSWFKDALIREIA